MGKMLREKIVNELTDRYKDTENCVFLDFTGLNVETLSQFRQRLKENDFDIFIVKNSLLKLAMDKIGLPVNDDLFEKPTAVVAGGDDPIAICKFIMDWQKKAAKSKIKGGLLDKKLLTRRDVVDISRLPSKEVLLSQILGLFITPMTNIANLLNNTMTQFANLINNHVEKAEKESKNNS